MFIEIHIIQSGVIYLYILILIAFTMNFNMNRRKVLYVLLEVWTTRLV